MKMRSLLKIVLSLALLKPILLISNKIIESVERPNLSLPQTLTFESLKKNGSLDQQALKFLVDVFECTLFIESGTYAGDTALNASTTISKVITIELSKQLYKEAKKRFSAIDNITIYNDDTIKILPSILKSNAKEKIIFWLDGHFSSGGTAKGDSNTPILKELECIKNAGITDSIMLIDDIRFFQTPPHDPSGTAYADYPDLVLVLEKVLEINPDYKCVLCGDILMCYLPTKSLGISPTLYACTLSRLWQEDQQALSLEELGSIERDFISHSKGSEKKYIKSLYDSFIHEENGTFFGLNKYFSFWKGLLSLKDSETAKKFFNQAIKAGFEKNRIAYHLKK